MHRPDPLAPLNPKPYLLLARVGWGKFHDFFTVGERKPNFPLGALSKDPLGPDLQIVEDHTGLILRGNFPGGIRRTV